MTLSRLRLSIIALVASTISISAYADSWLSEGFDWTLPDYATVPGNGGMLDINNAASNRDPEVPGVLMRLLWSESEAVQGQYDFSRFDTLLDSVSDARVLVRLEVNSQCHAPDWATIPYSSTQNLQFWSPRYVEQLSGFVNAFAERYKDNPRLVGVHLGMADGEYYQRLGDGSVQSNCPDSTSYDDLVDGGGRDGWGEFWWTLAEEAIYEADGLTPVNFEQSVINIIDLYANAFGASNTGKIVFMGYGGFGSAAYQQRIDVIKRYAIATKLGNRDGQIEAWMRYTDNDYGVDLKTRSNTDGSCSMTFDEAFADSIEGRYWGDENEFYGDLGYVTDTAVNPDGFVGPLSNQAYRFLVSSMRALQMRKNYVSINTPGHRYLRSINEQFEYEYTNDGAYDSALLTKFRSADFLTYLSRTLGRTRTDTPDAFLLLGERTISTFSGLYPDEYKASNTQEPCLLEADRRGYATVSDFGRWLSVVSETVGDQSMRKNMPDSENRWGQIMSAPRNGVSYELYARKSPAMYLDINNQLIQERCQGICKIQVKVVFKDERVMNLQVVPTNGTPGATLSTVGDGQTRTATFELNDFSGGQNLPDFHVKTLDGTDLSVLLMRVNFLQAQPDVRTPEPPVPLSPSGSINTTGEVSFSWENVPGATEYRVSHFSPGGYDGGTYASAADLNCESGICSIAIAGLQAGQGQWWVRGKNSAGESNWSQTLDFDLSMDIVTPTSIELLVNGPGDANGYVVLDNQTRQWIDAACRQQLSSAGLTETVTNWNVISGFTSATDWQSCSDLVALADDGGNTPGGPINGGNDSIQLLSNSSNSTSGYVVIDGATRQWIDGACRQQLVGAGLPLNLSNWAEISGYALTMDWRTCADLLVMVDSDDEPPVDEPDISIQLLQNGAGDTNGYVVLDEQTRQWVDGTCRQQLVAAGLVAAVSNWGAISGFAKSTNWRSCDALVTLVD